MGRVRERSRLRNAGRPGSRTENAHSVLSRLPQERVGRRWWRSPCPELARVEISQNGGEALGVVIVSVRHYDKAELPYAPFHR